MAKLFDEIIAVLAPDLGESMARSCVSMHLQKAGLSSDSIRTQHLAELVGTLKPGLSVFVGRATAEHLGARVLELADKGDALS